MPPPNPEASKVHKTYELLLSLLSLSPEHTKALATRGLNTKDCARLSYRSLPVSRREIVERLQEKGAILAGVPGFWRDDTGVWQLAGKCGIIVPIRDGTGNICALKIRVDKPSSPSAKYLLLSSNPKADKKSGEVKYPHGTGAPLLCHYPLGRPKGRVRALRITEGELKADIATEMLPQYTVSIPGVTSWRLGLELVRELKPDKVILAFDSDKAKPMNSEGSEDSSYGEGGKAHEGVPSADDFAVGKALASLYLALKESGEVREVVIEDWPLEAGKGIDDVLMNGATDKLRELEGEEAEEFAAAMLRADVPGGWIYVVGVKRFYHTRNLLELDKEQFADRYAHEAKGNPATKALANPAFPKVDLPIYAPAREMLFRELESEVRYFNLWRAHPLKPAKGSVAPFLEHIAYLFPEEREARIALDWLAWQVQRPGEKVHWALLVQGIQGTGKSYLGRIMRLLLGERNVSCPTNDVIHEPYTAWQCACQLVIVEELMARGRLDLMNKLKPMITQDITIVRDMYKPAYSQPNVFNLLMFTNHEDAVILDKSDRRYCILFSPAEPRAPDYYEALWTWTLGNAGRLLSYFLARDLKAFLPKAHAPMTEGKREVIGLSTPPLVAWIEEAVAEEKWPFMGDLVSVTHLLDIVPSSLKSFATAQGLSRALKMCGGRLLGQIRLKNEARVRVWAVRRVEVWEGATMETLAGEYEKWLGGAQPGGSPDAVNPLRESRPF